MRTPLRLTERDTEVLEALLTKVRLISLRQLAENWFQGELANARRRARILASTGWLRPIQVGARPLPPLEKPVYSWRPGVEEPDCGQISSRLISRWRGRAVRTMTAYLATPEAAKLLGGKGREELPHPTQATHDLGVTEVWLGFRRHLPELAKAWRGEDVMSASLEEGKLPDAFLVGPEDDIRAAIEFGGAYRPERVQAFHEHCVDHQLPYSLY